MSRDSAGQFANLLSPSAKALEIRAWEFHFRTNEWNNGRKARAIVAVARLVWIGVAGDLLAVELDVARDADGVLILPAVAGVCARGGCVGGAPNGQFAVGAITSGFCCVVRGLLAGVVDFRSDQ